MHPFLPFLPIHHLTRTLPTLPTFNLPFLYFISFLFYPLYPSSYLYLSKPSHPSYPSYPSSHSYTIPNLPILPILPIIPIHSTHSTLPNPPSILNLFSSKPFETKVSLHLREEIWENCQILMDLITQPLICKEERGGGGKREQWCEREFRYWKRVRFDLVGGGILIIKLVYILFYHVSFNFYCIIICIKTGPVQNRIRT